MYESESSGASKQNPSSNGSSHVKKEITAFNNPNNPNNQNNNNHNNHHNHNKGMVHQIISPISNSKSMKFFNECLLFMISFSTGKLRKIICFQQIKVFFFKVRKIRGKN